MPSARHLVCTAQSLLNLAEVLDEKRMYKAADQLSNKASRLIRIASEWWLKDGEAVYSDGDVGDVNHEMIAEDEILSRMGFDLDDGFGETMTKDYASTLFADRMRRIHDYVDHLQELYKDDPEGLEDAYLDADLFEYLLWLRMQGHSPEEEQAIRQEMQHLWSGFKDPRNYAVQNFGWHRVHNNHIQTYTLNQEVLNSIVAGLEDAYEDADERKFYIEVKSIQKYIGPLNLEDMSSGAALKHIAGPESSDEINSKKRPALPGAYYKRDGD